MKSIPYDKLLLNPMSKISNGWMCVVAGTDIVNAMTLNWGMMGSLFGRGYGRPVVSIFIRPSRYTRNIIDKEKYFTICFFDEKYKKNLVYLGTHTGFKENKIANCGFTLVKKDKYSFFSEANLVIALEKIYVDKLNENGFIDSKLIEENYPDKDFHYMYIGKIIDVLEA